MLVASSIRGEIKCRANALPFIKPLKVADREIEITGLPGHFGYHGIGRQNSQRYNAQLRGY